MNTVASPAPHGHQFAPLLFGLLIASLDPSAPAHAAGPPANPPGSEEIEFLKLRLVASFGHDRTEPLWPGTERMALGPDGALYSTTTRGGKHGRGTIYKVTPQGEVTILHDFEGGRAGEKPMSGLTLANDSLYGTTFGGGDYKVGTIFRIGLNGGTPSTLFSFRNGWLPRLPRGQKYSEQELLDAAGSYPTSVPVQATDGHLYGVTPYARNQKWGVLYRVGSGGGFKALYYFDGAAGRNPGVLVAGDDGHLYGTTFAGSHDDNRFGTVFKATTSGAISVLHEFKRSTGAPPVTLLYGRDGNLYGTTYGGGLGPGGGEGVIFKISLRDGGGYSVLHMLDGRSEGSTPVAALAEGPDGFLYGASCFGGKRNGTIFRLRRDGSEFSVVDSFAMYTTGHSPKGALLMHPDGTLYGTTYQGGARANGNVYAVTVCPLVGRTDQPEFRGGDLWWSDDLVEVRTGVAAFKNNQPVPDHDDGITIKVKSWRDPHIVQFIYRAHVLRDGSLEDGYYAVRNPADATNPFLFRLTTNEGNRRWRHDSLGKPDPYYESSGAYRDDCTSRTTFDQPSLAPVDKDVHQFRRAVAMVFVIVDGKVVRQFQWKREIKSQTPYYDVSQPVPPNERDVQFFHVQTAAEGFDPWPTEIGL